MSNIMCCGKNKKFSSHDNHINNGFEKMNEEQKKAHIDHLWNLARRYNNKLRF